VFRNLRGLKLVGLVVLKVLLIVIFRFWIILIFIAF
jgi:hypothetical protein